MARIDDTDRVFDVSRPHKVGPSPTSKPVIVGHRPEQTDTMVKEDTLFSDTPAKASTNVKVWTDEDEKQHDEPAKNSWELTPESDSSKSSEQHDSSELFSSAGASPEASKEPEQSYTPLQSLLDKEEDDKKDEPKPDNDSGGGDDLIGTLPLSHPTGAGPKKSKKTLWAILILLVLLVGSYVAVDALVTSVKLPYEFFKEKEVATQPVIAPAPTPPPAPTTPTGFTLYKVEATAVSFAYPTTWGAPTVTKEEGFTKRGGTNKSDGTYAYIVTFATNKDVEIALTSSKYLPATRTATYYDFLRWCVGTNDDKIYKEVLNFTTADKIDTPTTVTCNQGPLADATQVPSTGSAKWIVQLKTKDAADKVIGDLYTKNLADKSSIAVMRIKDAAMTQSENIEKLLETIKEAEAASTDESN